MHVIEKLTGILVAGIVGLVALAFASIYLMRSVSDYVVESGLSHLFTGDHLLHGFFHMAFLAFIGALGWFSALRVGIVIPMPLKITVLAATAVLYYLVSTIWISLIGKFFTKTLPMAGPDMFGGPIMLIIVLGSAALVIFVIYKNMKSAA